ncbi:hypothetical protein ACODT5_34280 [Streptomyces sp. 5.8]|uniref:hypothetical protein n=2 Tax=unclassified Streptomyces TaxID=2593676 RepID=UPI003BB68DE5
MGAKATPSPPEPTAEPPIEPFHPFNDIGAPIVLHSGDIGGVEEKDLPGEVTLSCAPRLGLDWKVTPTPSSWPNLMPDLSEPGPLLLRRPYGDYPMDIHTPGSEGSSNGATLGDAESPITRMVAHWFNLPRFEGQHHLSAGEGQERVRPRSRWMHEVDGWRITLDVRPDHKEIWPELRRSRVYAMTHVMEISRCDGGDFTSASARRVLTALHTGLSFSLGRWVAPMLPVGFAADGRVVWEEWRVMHCDPARNSSGGWWEPLDPAPLARFLDGLVPAYADPARSEALRLQINYAITAISGEGFVEQRVIIGAAGLEHMMWQRLHMEAGWNRKAYDSLHAHARLRRILQDVSVPTSIDSSQLPALAQFANENQSSDGSSLDGPEALTRVRNSLVHPKESQKKIYGRERVVVDAWLLARHYLTLLILESLGYHGDHRNLAQMGSWQGEVSQTPWA